MRRIRNRLTYANVVATLALVIAVAGGTAYAANTVFSADIVDGEVKTADVRNDTLSGGGLTAADLRNGSVGNTEIADGGVRSAEVQNEALTGADIAESTLQNVNAGKLAAFRSARSTFRSRMEPARPPSLIWLGCRSPPNARTSATSSTSRRSRRRTARAPSTSGSLERAPMTRTQPDTSIPHRSQTGASISVNRSKSTIAGTPGTGDISTGALNYSAPDGSVVVARLALDNPEGGGCALTGIATGG